MCLAEFGVWYDTDKSTRDNQVDNDQLPTNTVAEEAIQVDIQSEQNFEKIIILEKRKSVAQRQWSDTISVLSLQTQTCTSTTACFILCLGLMNKVT